MPRYDYFCDDNGATVEVRHPMSRCLDTWGELCELAGIDMGDTDAASPVRRVVTKAPAAAFPVGDAVLKNRGFTKLEKRYDGTYENVTATGTEARFMKPGDSSTLPHLHRKISD